MPNTIMANRRHLFLTGNPAAGKTTLLVNAVKSIIEELLADGSSANVIVRGFYTTECRQGDQRCGFDICHLLPFAGVRLEDMANGGIEKHLRTAPLSRIGPKKAAAPMVGKYVVDIPSIQATAIPSIDFEENDSNSDDTTINLVLLDEIGKMEMLCPGFLDAVDRCLNCPRSIVLGTIPTPRYGRCIKAVEDVRARNDVTVAYVTKSNRDELRDVVRRVLISALRSKDDGCDVSMTGALSPYLYDRPINAPAMNKPGSGEGNTSQTAGKNDVDCNSQQQCAKPCGPLVPSNNTPTVLALGDTSSPEPEEKSMAYSERSMWSIFAEMVHGRSPSSTNLSKEEFQTLRDEVLSKGICIWDVSSDVHVKGKKTGQKKRAKTTNNVNPIVDFVSERQSIAKIAFIGGKAKKSFASNFCIAGTNELVLDNGIRKIELVVLPSSSRANSRMTVAEKAAEWRSALLS